MKDTIVIDYAPVPFKIKAKELFRQLPGFFKSYFAGIFPIVQWIHRYNLTWLVQDVIAGVTVGIVIVPQSMAYAKIANLDPQYGLYTSFVGVSLYCFFGTSKDISIGPISTVSLLVSSVVNSVTKMDPSITNSEIAVTLSLFAGIVMLIISFLRLGILVDFIPEPAIAGYMTGSAITIVLGQCPKLFGIPDVSTHESPYLIFGNVLAKLPHTRLDVAFGLTSLVFLYAVRFICGKYTCKSPHLQKAIFLFSIMRNGLIVIIGTFISFLISRGQSSSPISIIQSVPAGFDAMGVPSLRFDILKEAGGIVPSIVLIMVLEHISVAKAFGRIYDYQINPDQEILAIGVSNIVGSFFGGYPATGAFSRTAIMARSGSRTPIAGVFSGAIVVLALYALTPAFYYIPDAVLAAVVIHAVSDLASGSKYLKELWLASNAELFVWVSAVIVTIFVDVESGIYAAVGLSLLLMLYKLARPPIKTLTRISAHDDKPVTGEIDKHYIYVDEADPNFKDYIIAVPSGILILKLCGSVLYPNAEHISDAIVHTIKQKTR
ncbi:sulfate transporter family-domain-containing protein, partial [Parasitella parasitica]